MSLVSCSKNSIVSHSRSSNQSIYFPGRLSNHSEFTFNCSKNLCTFNIKWNDLNNI